MSHKASSEEKYSVKAQSLACGVLQREVIPPYYQQTSHKDEEASPEVRAVQDDEPLEHLIKMEPMPKNTLSVQLTSFVGREQDVQAVSALLQRPEQIDS